MLSYCRPKKYGLLVFVSLSPETHLLLCDVIRVEPFLPNPCTTARDVIYVNDRDQYTITISKPSCRSNIRVFAAAARHLGAGGHIVDTGK